MLPLGSCLPLPGFDRIQFFSVGKGAKRDFIEKRFHNRSAGEQQLLRSILSGDALSDPDLFSLGIVLPSAVWQDPGFQFSTHRGIKTGRGIAPLCAFLRLAGTKNGKAHLLSTDSLFCRTIRRLWFGILLRCRILAGCRIIWSRL